MPGAAERIAARHPDPGDAAWFRAPGRVNLIGDHTDYNEGFVLPMAVDLDCVIAARPARSIRVTSLDLGGTVDVTPGAHANAAEDMPGWGRLVAEIARELADLGRPQSGMDAVVASDVPIGSGLSSSAAFEVAVAVALAGLVGWSPGPLELASACRDAEERASGVPCGIMDQLAALCGRSGHALLLDCRSLEVTPVPLPARLGVLVVHSGQPRALAESAYADRRRACEALAARLGLRSLRDANPSLVAEDPFGRHVVTENARVLEAVDALASGDLARMGKLMLASHASLRDDFQVSTPELDALVDALMEAGAAGARLTGAGFGGSVVAVCERDQLPEIAGGATFGYRRRTGLEPRSYACRAADGAGPVAPPGARS